RVKAKGGWEAVDALWARLPASTEQALHPAKLGGDRDQPVRVTLPDLASSLGDEWRRTAEDTLGELGVQCFLEEHGVAPAVVAKPAGGGGGARARGYGRDIVGLAALGVTRWDTDADAGELEAGGGQALGNVREPHLLQRRGKLVALTIGAPELEGRS